MQYICCVKRGAIHYDDHCILVSFPGQHFMGISLSPEATGFRACSEQMRPKSGLLNKTSIIGVLLVRAFCKIC